jgi:hypothetical protein
VTITLVYAHTGGALQVRALRFAIQHADLIVWRDDGGQPIYYPLLALSRITVAD